MQLRQYQQDAIAAIRVAWRRDQSVLLQLPTGGGKTVIFSEITRLATARGRTVLILVHRRELINQASDKLTKLGVDHGIICAGYKPSTAPVQIASVHTLVRRLRLQMFEPALIIIDEAHHAIPGNTYGKIVNNWPDAYCLGVTATPCRLDGKGLGRTFTRLIPGPSVQDLTALGHLSPAKLYAPPLQVDLTGLRTRAGDYVAEQAGEAMNHATITGDVISHYRKHAEGAPAVAFCCTVGHAHCVAAQFRESGICAAVLLGETPAAERTRLIEEFAAGLIQVMVTVDVVSEGFDCPTASVAILLRPTQSESLYLQQVGRVLRPSPGKTHALVLDHVGNISRHGFPDDTRDWSLSDRKKRGSKGGPPAPTVSMCPSCYAAFKPAAVCPMCGHPMQVRKELTEVDGELVELQRRQQRRQIGRARTLEQLKAVAKERGYKPGWAYQIYNGRKGR